MNHEISHIEIREARDEDSTFVIELMDAALAPYYGGDHRAHAKRIFSTHISGGKDNIGHFSFEQIMFILTVRGARAGMIHIVGKRQGNYKISPLIVVSAYKQKGLGTALLQFAEEYAKRNGARQIYCTLAEQNKEALKFFIRKGYVVAGRSDSHYKPGITEVMLYKLFLSRECVEMFDRPNISVVPCDAHHEGQVRCLLLDTLPKDFRDIDANWIDALFNGYKRRGSGEINLKYKLIYVAVDRSDTVLGIAGATPKKGEPIKLMPLVATTLPAFGALLTDVPYLLKPFGRKLYIHITPSVEQTIGLQQHGWKLDGAMPGAYHEDRVTQQWSLDISQEDFMRNMRVKQNFLDAIRKGEKTLEVRVAYDNIRGIQPGDRIKLASRTEAQVIRVKGVRQYQSFEIMLDKEEAERIAPGKTKQEVLSLLKEIYPPQRERLGVVVLEVQKD